MVSPHAHRTCPRIGRTYYLHRAVAAWKLGRPLQPGEVAHHRNGDPTDNHPDNLRGALTSLADPAPGALAI